MQTHDLKPFVRGDSYAIPVSFKRGGKAVDFTGWTLWFTAKHNALQPDADAAIQKRVTVTGSATIIALSKDDTQHLPPTSYTYDLQLVSPTGDVVKTLVGGKLKLDAGVTERT